MNNKVFNHRQDIHSASTVYTLPTFCYNNNNNILLDSQIILRIYTCSVTMLPVGLKSALINGNMFERFCAFQNNFLSYELTCFSQIVYHKQKRFRSPNT